MILIMNNKIRQEKIEKLNEIYKSGEGGGENAAFLLSCCGDEDYLVRTRAFALGERLGGEEIDRAMLEVALGEGEREWQLRALNSLAHSGSYKAVAALTPLLSQCSKPLLLRGCVWVMASAKAFDPSFALNVLGDFITSPYVGYLKVAFVADSLNHALGRSEEGAEFWERLCAADSKIARAYSYFRQYVSVKPPLFQVYPYPDYLSKMGAKKQITPKELKYALYFKGKPGEKGAVTPAARAN